MLKLLAPWHLLIGNAAIALSLRRKPDGWRRVVGVGLRDEPSKFVLSAFGLTPPEDGPVSALARFLRTEPDAQFTLQHTRWLTTRHRCDTVDLVELVFTPDGTLAGLNPHLDPQRARPSPEVCERAVAAVVSAYAATRHLPESVRPLELVRAAGDDPFARRLLEAACVSFDHSDGPRFAPPEFRTCRGLGFGHLTFVLRTAGETVDVWALAHHTGTDGVPLQEMLTRLEQSWGAEEARYPAADEFTDGPRACHLPGEREVWQSVSFHDLTPLLAERKRLNAEQGLTVPLAALLLWVLSREPEFAGVKFSSTVDVPAVGESERDVDLIALRPADSPDLPIYTRAFTAAVDAARVRTGPTRGAISDAELLPPWLHRKLLEADPKGVADTFGSVGLSVVKGAKVFVAPLSDVGFPGGFIAVGSADLPTVGVGTTTAITVKGTKEQAERYPAVFRRVLAKLAARGAVGV